MRVTDKVAIVTGAGSGIGRASAIALAREGARVTVVDTNPENGKETESLICEKGGKAVFIPSDVSRTDDVRRMVAQVVEEFRAIDILHNNAGIAVRKPVAEQDEEGWDQCVRVNLRSVFLCSKYVIPHMIGRGGSIINTSSVTGIVGVRNRPAYSTTKGGVLALTKNMALDYAQFKIRVNCICPGFTRTPFIAGLLQDPVKTRKLTALHPLGRLGTPEDIANGVLFLASDESAWMTGQALVIDGGFSVGHSDDI
jgi:NAD(P)-dependent dehydrogenase (short-subunit alcohol dehydrogenase family)